MIIEIPASKICRCDRCQCEQPVPGDRIHPIQWTRLEKKLSAATETDTLHLCLPCSDEFEKWMANRPLQSGARP